MKRLLLLTLLCFSTAIAIAQTTWTGAGANTNWNNTDNWDTNLVPTASDDVIIPTGFTVTLNVASTVKSFDVQGNSTFNMNTNITFSEPSTIGVNAIVNWAGGTINGGGSTLTNNGTINTGSTNVVLNGITTINNENAINLTGIGDIFIGTDSTINNNAAGTIDFQFSGSNISASGIAPRILNNTGLIKTSFAGTDFANIGVEFTNNGGTIQVEGGTLNLANSNIVLNGGIYNVFVDANLDWDTALEISGVFTGNIAGTLNWRQTVTVTTTATFNFGGTEIINWLGGNVDGGGTLTNQSKIHTNSANVIVTNGSTLINQDTINLTAAGDIFIGTNSAVNNEIGAVIDFQFNGSGISASGIPPRNLNNTGLIKTSFPGGTDSALIAVEFTNNDGTIQVENGILNLTNAAIVLNDGTYNVFPTGTLDWDTTLTISGTLTGALDGVLNLRNGFSSPGVSTVNFTGNETISWVGGSIIGGGTFTNEDIISTLSANVFVNGATTVNNNGAINLDGAGDIFIGTDSVLNNQIGGAVEFKFPGSGISASGIAPRVFNNFGLIKMTMPLDTDASTLNLEFNNIDGAIQVETGVLNLSNPAITLTDGTYNTFATGTLDWDLNVILLGTLSGTMDGVLNWRNSVTVNTATTATLGFGGAANIIWPSGSVIGGGALINQSNLKIQTGNVFINGGSTLNNEGSLDFDGAGDLFIATNGILNNEAPGTINMLTDAGNISPSGTAPQTFNNLGTLNASAPTLVTIAIPSFNSGTINVNSGELDFSTILNNQTTGVISGVGTLDIPVAANFTNDGTTGPGGSPGILTVLGDYSSTASAVLDVELDGLAQGAEYDLLAITGTNVVFEGNVNISIGFDANVNDTFIIATTTGTIATGNLVTPIIVEQDGKRYTFDVTYPGNNQVLLTISDKLDIEPPTVITKNITVQLGVSGNVSITTNDIDDGSIDNCTLQANLLYALDITDFTCDDLGDNTVSLTVTDEAGNFASADATVTVEDSINPTVVTQNITVQLDASGNASITTGDINNGSSDNCTVETLSLDITDFTCDNLGTNIVTLTVTDQSSNSASAPATVTVSDSIDPIVITQNITVQLDASGNVSIVPADVNDGSSDNCMMDTLSLDITDFTCADLGPNTVELTVTDQSGNSASATSEVTVVDSVDPIVVTQDITVQLDASGNVSIVPADVNDGSSDNCMMDTLSLDITDFTCADLGSNTVELTVTDQSGNSAMATAMVTISDNTSPELICPGDFTVSIDGGVYTVPDYFLEGDVIDSDNCDNDLDRVQTPIPGTVLGVGSYIITVGVTDDSGNSAQCMFNVTVEDALGIDDQEFLENKLQLFPNPANDYIILKNNSNILLTRLYITDIKGSLIEEIDLNGMGTNKVISTQNYQSGMYFVKITAANTSVVKRLIKQ